MARSLDQRKFSASCLATPLPQSSVRPLSSSSVFTVFAFFVSSLHHPSIFNHHIHQERVGSRQARRARTGASLQVQGPRFQCPRFQVQAPGSRFKVPVPVPVQDSRSRFKFQSKWCVHRVSFPRAESLVVCRHTSPRSSSQAPRQGPSQVVKEAGALCVVVDVVW